MNICIYICICMYVCHVIYTYIYKCVYIYMYTCIHTYIYITPGAHTIRNSSLTCTNVLALLVLKYLLLGKLGQLSTRLQKVH